MLEQLFLKELFYQKYAKSKSAKSKAKQLSKTSQNKVLMHLSKQDNSSLEDSISVINLKINNKYKIKARKKKIKKGKFCTNM